MHPFGVIYHILPTVYTRKYVDFTNDIVSSLVDGRTINAWQDIYLQVTTPNLQGRRRCHTISTNISICFIMCLFVYNLCGTSAMQYIWLQISLSYASVHNCTLGYNLIFQTVCNHTLYSTKIALQTDRSFLWQQDLGP